MKSAYISELIMPELDGHSVQTLLAVRERSVKTTKNGGQMTNLVFVDRTGQLDAVLCSLL